MTVRRYTQLDVFGARPGAGNPLAVVHDAAGMDEAAMQAFAAWTNLSETIFFLPPGTQGADYRIRIFTPKMELPFAGHPSVGAAWAALDAGLARDRDGRLVQECAAGLLPVRIDRTGDRVMPSVRSPRAQPRGSVAPPDWLCASQVLGCHPRRAGAGAVEQRPGLVAAGAGRRDRGPPPAPDQAAIAGLPGSGKLAVFAHADNPVDTQLVVRAFAPGVGIAEDPATGSVNASIASLLHRHGRLPGAGGRYVASQGREVGRDARSTGGRCRRWRLGRRPRCTR